jgi:hypothetical protein
MAERINFFLQWEEYFAAQEFFRRSRQSVAPELLAGGALLLLGLLLLFVEGMNIVAILALALGLAVMILAPQVRRWSSKHKWQREPLYETEHEVSFSDDGVYFRMGVIESNLNWKYYQRVMESPNGLLMVYGNDSFNLLPKRAFADETLFNQFRSLATKNLK